MLTQMEWKQIRDTLYCMDQINIVGRGPMISLQNTVVLIGNYVDLSESKLLEGENEEDEGE